MGTTTARPKAVILGIDGGSLELIEPLVAEGVLPCLGALLAGSAYGTTTTTWPAHTAPGWSTFVSARQPGGHGIYQFFDTQDPGYGDRLLGTADFGCTTVWEWLAQQGYSVGLINVPMSHPPRDLPGYQVTWPLEQTLRYSSPSGLLGELARAGAPFKPDIAAMFRGDLGYLDFALEHIRARTRSIRYLMTHHPVDVVMAVITEIDRICHHYWHFCDPCHPHHEEPARAGWANAIRSSYVALDDAFAEILELVGDEVPVLLVSDHGFGAGRGSIAVNVALAEAGLLSTRADGPGRYASWFHAEGQAVDFGRTRAYMPTPGCYAVNVNLAGRQREGIVAERDAPAVLAEAAELFLDLRAADTGDRVFRAALPREEAYPGVMCRSAPDLLLVPADEGVLASSDIRGPVWRPSEQTGLHRYAGMWALRCPELPTGRYDSSVALVDLAPTLLHELGLRFPASVHGRPLAEALRSGRDPLPFLTDAAAAPALVRDSTRHLRDDDLTTKTLSAMGYL